MKRGGPLKRKTPLTAGGPLTRSAGLRRAPLARVSSKRRSEAQERRDVNAEVIARDGGCVPRLRGAPGACFGPLAAHEVLKRSAGGSHLDPRNCVAACSFHNGWIEDNPKAARALGLVRSSWEREERP